MHNLHFQGLVGEAILIDAPTQDVTLFCLLCLPVTFSWIMSLTSLLFIRSVTEVLWSAQLCCYDASVFVTFFPTCFSCLIDFCNPMNSCINMTALFQRQVTQPFWYIILLLSWHLWKSMFNKGLGVWNFFFLNAQLKLVFDLQLGFTLEIFSHSNMNKLHLNTETSTWFKWLIFSLSVLLSAWQFLATIAAE